MTSSADGVAACLGLQVRPPLPSAGRRCGRVRADDRERQASRRADGTGPAVRPSRDRRRSRRSSRSRGSSRRPTADAPGGTLAITASDCAADSGEARPHRGVPDTRLRRQAPRDRAEVGQVEGVQPQTAIRNGGATWVSTSPGSRRTARAAPVMWSSSMWLTISRSISSGWVGPRPAGTAAAAAGALSPVDAGRTAVDQDDQPAPSSVPEPQEEGVAVIRLEGFEDRTSDLPSDRLHRAQDVEQPGALEVALAAEVARGRVEDRFDPARVADQLMVAAPSGAPRSRSRAARPCSCRL